MDLVKRYVAMLQRDRRPADLVFSIAFLVFALTTLFLFPNQTTWVDGKGLFTQPMFWPGIGMLMMVGFGTIHVLGAVVSQRQIGRGQEVLFWLRSLEFVAWFLIYVSAVPLLGYLLSTLVFAVLLTLRLGYRSRQSLFWAAAFGVAVVVVFKAGLRVNVPAGAIYAYLPDSIRTFAMVNF